MRTRLAEGVAERERVLSGFLEVEKQQIALCCHAMARAFARGGTLIAFGTRTATTDAAHVAVEFMHPVIVGKRALPALAPTNDPTGASTLLRLARPGDIALGIAHSARAPGVSEFLAEARERGLLAIVLWGPGEAPSADFSFSVACSDEQIVQEVQETAYHVLWELVHVFFEHPGLLGGDACITCGDVAVRGRVVEVRRQTAVVDVDGLREEVATELLEDGVAVGESVLCHAGVALEKLA
jgi:D-sedoheptulose 7-phosphate isomerase